MSVLIPVMSFYHLETMANDHEGGVSFGSSTRIIFNGKENKISFPVNNGSERPYIFHALVLNEDLKSYCPEFIVSPEVVHIPQKHSRMAQIVRIGGSFPEDRETLFYLQGHFLPGVKDEVNNKLSMRLSYSIKMKMFFRPDKLHADFDAVDKVADQLDFNVDGNKLIVKNKSAYYLTLNEILLGDKHLPIPDESSMIAPFGLVDFILPKHYEKKITWTLINDGGYATKPLTRNL